MEHAEIQDGLFNVGAEQDVTIPELAKTVMDFKGKIVFDASKLEGTRRTLPSVDRLRVLGWQAKTSLREGLTRAYAEF